LTPYVAKTEIDTVNTVEKIHQIPMGTLVERLPLSLKKKAIFRSWEVSIKGWEVHWDGSVYFE